MQYAAPARRQTGNTLYIALSALVLIATGAVIYLYTQDKSAPDEEALPEQNQPVLNAEPEPIQSVDMQSAKIETAPQQQQAASSAKPAQADTSEGLFASSGRKLALKDGMTGGRESTVSSDPQQADTTTPKQTAHALDAFDYGVLDGRVRIGVFGKGPIRDYRVRLTSSHYLIEMPGEFRHVENFAQALVIERFGVSQAQLTRNTRGIQMRIDVTPALKHQPFLIEDAKGLIIAFEPQRN